MYQDRDLEHFHLQVNKDLSLVAPQLLHAKAVFDLIQRQRSYFGAWLSWVDQTRTLQDVQRFIRETQAFNEGGQRLTTFIIYQSQIVGSVGFTCLNMRHKKGEVGYWLSEHLQGKGFVTQSCLHLLNFGFSNLKLHRAEIRILSGNEKSKGIPLRLGFQREGTLLQSIWLNGRYHNMEIYGLLASDWGFQKKQIADRIVGASF